MTSSFTFLRRPPIASGAIRILSIALSLGVHYLIASNLGLFVIPEPPKLRPAGGTVKVVDLTPAERSRVPDVVKSSTLPIASTPVNPAVVIQGQGSSFGFNNRPAPSVPSPAPSPAPAPNRSASNPTPAVQPSVNRTPNVTVSPSGRFGLDRDRNLSAFPTGSPGGPGGSQSPTSTNFPPSPNSPPGGAPGTLTPTGPTPTPSPSRPTQPPTPPVNNLVQVQRQFDQEIQRLRQSIGSRNIEERDVAVSARPYPAINKCRNDQNGYILVAVLLDESGAVDDTGSFIPLQISSFLGEKLNNILATRALEESGSIAQQEHARRSPAQKLRDQGKKILYKIKFEYLANSCRA